MIFVLDNYDSFTYNLVQYVGTLGYPVRVMRNDQITIAEIETLNPSHIIISPGPGYPAQAGISKEVIAHFHKTVPILGVCLGHQAIGEVFGGTIGPAGELVHGKPAEIFHQADGILKGLPSPFEAARYHSLIVNRESIPECLHITAETEDGLVMGLRHKNYPTFGLQFHPESILTTKGIHIIQNFLEENHDD